jgi:hypothetical protein
MTAEEHVAEVARRLVGNLRDVVELRDWTTNTELLGAYAESMVRDLVRNIVSPLRVSTGTVVDYPVNRTAPQLDVVIWAPFPAPALFASGEFAVVPRSSAFGALEIKWSNYSAVNAGGWHDPIQMRALLAESGSEEPNPSLGVVGLLTSSPGPGLRGMLEAGSAVAMFEVDGGGNAVVRARDVVTLVNRLNYIRWRYQSASVHAPLELIQPAG